MLNHAVITLSTFTHYPGNHDEPILGSHLRSQFVTAIKQVSNSVIPDDKIQHYFNGDVAVENNNIAEPHSRSEKIATTLRSLLASVISADGSTFAEELDSIYLRRAVLLATQIEVVSGKTIQPAFCADEILTLEKHGEHYWLKKEADNSQQQPDGYYIFIIPRSAPNKIWCAPIRLEGMRRQTLKNIKGHTSFAGEQTVHFAGVLRFFQGRLIFWNNASGHFMPPAELRYTLLSYIKCVLPETLFINYLITQHRGIPLRNVYPWYKGIS